MKHAHPCLFFFCFTDTTATEIYTLSLHDALPISAARSSRSRPAGAGRGPAGAISPTPPRRCDRRECTGSRSEEHTSELQSPYDLVCRLLLEKKKYKSTKECMLSTSHIITQTL